MHVRTHAHTVYARTRTHTIIIVDIINFRVITLRSRPAIFDRDVRKRGIPLESGEMHSRATVTRKGCARRLLRERSAPEKNRMSCRKVAEKYARRSPLLPPFQWISDSQKKSADKVRLTKYTLPTASFSRSLPSYTRFKPAREGRTTNDSRDARNSSLGKRKKESRERRNREAV